MPETGENVPDAAAAAQESAWASFHDATHRRRAQHLLVRNIVSRRVSDGFDEAFGKSLEPKEKT